MTEYNLLEQRLGKAEPERTFFSFANTVKIRPYQSVKDAHGWIGIQFQANSIYPPSKIFLHARMCDKSKLEQQHAVGILSANLICGAFYLRHQPEDLIESRIDNLSPNRIEVDLINLMVLNSPPPKIES